MKMCILFVLFGLLLSCSTEPDIIKPYTDHSYATADSIHISIVSEKAGILIVIAGSESQTLLPPEDPDCGQYIYTSHWYYHNTIPRRHDTPYIRVEIDHVSYPAREL